MIKILHVTEALGGVPISIQHLVNATPEHEHYYYHLAFRPHFRGITHIDNATMVPGRNGFRAIVDYLKLLRSEQPDVVHAHSFFAGLLVRLLPRFRSRTFYTPHCFPTARTDVGPIRRWVLNKVELLLGLRTDTLVAISDREAIEARRLHCGRVRIVEAFNPTTKVHVRDPESRRRHPAVVSMVGRVTAQKDPQYFAEVARRSLAADSTRFEFHWYGGGDVDLEQILTEAGVVVHGWTSKDEVISHIADTYCYVHSAAWEGFPLSVTEAIDYDAYVLVRRTPSTPTIFNNLLETSPTQMADMLNLLWTDQATQAANLSEVRRIREAISRARLAEVMADVYK